MEPLGLDQFLTHLYATCYKGIPLSREDYLLGISDLSGELMRYAISAASMVGGRRGKVAEVCSFVRGCSAGTL